MRAPVTAPALKPARYGLIESSPRGDTGDRWEEGVAFTPRGCHVVFGHGPGCPGESKSDFQECSIVEADPWLLETGLLWATVDMAANPKDLVRETLEVGTGSVLERLTDVGVTDTAPATPIVANVPAAGPVSNAKIEGRMMPGSTPPPLLSDGLVDATAYTDPRVALGHLEAKLLDASDHTGQAGTILMSPIHAATLGDQIYEHAEHLYTKMTGSCVVVGNFVPGKIWGVAGTIDVYLSDIEVFDAFERKWNEYAVRAERYALAVWNCDVFGVTIGP